jgi:hypothetical protein
LPDYCILGLKKFDEHIMKKVLYLGIILSAIVLASCNGAGEGQENDGTDSLKVDTLDSTLVDSTLFMDDSGYVDEALETENIIEAKYGIQWDFCDCVVKNDSVNKAIDNAEDDATFDIILARMEQIDEHCKTMLTTPNTTPEERDKHERKVNKCLRDAKK